MATALAPKARQPLMAPEPLYAPSSGSPCSHNKATLGQSNRRLTRQKQLLTGPKLACSGQLLPSPPKCCSHEEEEEEAAEEEEEQPLEPSKAQRRGGQPAARLRPSGIPGYTAGFIPQARNHFAKSFGKISQEARSEFARQLMRGPLPGEGKGRWESQWLLPAQRQTPLAAVAQAAAGAPYVPRGAFHPQGSPYAMDDSNPQKCFVSGFTGFIPGAQYLIGASYPVITHRALVEFGRMLRRAGQGPSGSSTEAPQGHEALPLLAKVYPHNRGLLPHYKGYVPGYKFQFGHTFGRLTYNALGQSTLEKQVQDALLP